MPRKRNPDKAPVTVYLHRARVAAAQVRLAAEGRTMTELIGHALDEYAAGQLTLPPREHAAPDD